MPAGSSSRKRKLVLRRSNSTLRTNFAKEVLLGSNGAILVLVCQFLLEGLLHAEDTELLQDMLMFFFHLNVDPVDVWTPLRHLTLSCRGFCEVIAHDTPGCPLARLVDALRNDNVRELWERMLKEVSTGALKIWTRGPPMPAAPKYQAQKFIVPMHGETIRGIGKKTAMKCHPGMEHAATREENSRVFDAVKSSEYVYIHTLDRKPTIRKNMAGYVRVTSCGYDFVRSTEILSDIVEAMQLMDGFMLKLIAGEIDEHTYDELATRSIVELKHQLEKHAEILVYSLASHPDDLDRIVKDLEDTSAMWEIDFVEPKIHRDYRFLGDPRLVAKNGVRRLPQPDSPHEDASYVNTIRAFPGARNKQQRVEHMLYNPNFMCFTGVYMFGREEDRINAALKRHAYRVNRMIKRMHHEREAALAAGKGFELDPTCCLAVWREMCDGRTFL